MRKPALVVVLLVVSLLNSLRLLLRLRLLLLLLLRLLCELLLLYFCSLQLLWLFNALIFAAAHLSSLL